MDPLPRGRLRRPRLVQINESQIFNDANRLHAHEGRPLCRFCSNISCRVQREVAAFLIATDLSVGSDLCRKMSCKEEQVQTLGFVARCCKITYIMRAKWSSCYVILYQGMPHMYLHCWC